MHRISTKRLTAYVVSLASSLALIGSPALSSAQEAAARAATRPVKSTAAQSAPKTPDARAAGFKKTAVRKNSSGAATTPISGTVRDGSGHAWPLAARLEFTSAVSEPLDVDTDPVTGQYQADLLPGVDYTVVVTARVPGYDAGAGAFTTDDAPLVRDWALKVEAAGCTALGYEKSGFTPVFSESFDAGVLPEGWSVEQGASAVKWTIASGVDPCGLFEGNETGGAGPYALVNSNCDSDHGADDDTSLITPSVNASQLPSVAAQWANDYRDGFDAFGSAADVDVSVDGGATWTNVWEHTGSDLRGPGNVFAGLTGAAGHEDVKVRFHYTGYWGWWWQVDDVLIGEPLCTPVAGGLIVGNASDGNTGFALGGATVANEADASSTTTSPDGLYALFSPTGLQSLVASAPGYAPDAESATVVSNDTVRRDFVLQAARLDASPRPVAALIGPNDTTDKVLTLANSGVPAAAYKVLEFNVPLHENVTSGFVSQAERLRALARVPMDGKQRNDRARSSEGLAPRGSVRAVVTAPHVPAGASVVASYPTGILSGWGVATSGSSDVWLSNPAAFNGGDDLDYQYSNGVLTGNSIDDSGWIGSWAADGAYNPNTGMIWRVNVGGGNCLHELDPATRQATGKKICGDFSFGSQRGVAYDVTTDTYYVGGWNEGVVYHIDAEGTILDARLVELDISGLAYNPDNGHLLVMNNTGDLNDIVVLDAHDNYAVLDAYDVLDNGVPVFGDFEQAGMEFDCMGNLWMVNQITQVLYEVASSERPTCSIDVPWLTVTPAEGTVPGAASAPVVLTYNSTGLLPGLRQAHVQLVTDTPYAVEGVPVTLTVLFNDVPEGSFASNYIHGAAGAGVMRGCSFYAFCPTGVVTRADMAGYIERAIHGALAPLPAYLGGFSDVFFNSFNANYIQGLVNDGITAGCGDGTTFCPDSPNTRAQMSVFIWKARHGADAPPACTGIFADVPCPSGFAADYIEGIYNEGITAGCGGGNYCPSANISNAQMAVFLVKAFQIPYIP